MTRKRMYNYYQIYRKGLGEYSLYNCYLKPSTFKLNAFQRCEEKAYYLNRYYRGRILTYNRMMFTYGFTFKLNDKMMFAVITKTGMNVEEIDKINAYGNNMVHRKNKNRKQI